MQLGHGTSDSNFWWLTTTQREIYTYSELAHHRPISDDEQPYSVSWDTAAYPISGLDHWRNKFDNTNVYRNLIISSVSPGEDKLLGPYIVDIDNEHENMEDARDVARHLVKHLQQSYGIRANLIRLFFTGRKGFNIEVHPTPLQIQGPINHQIMQSADRTDQIINALRSGNTWPDANQVSAGRTLIDRIYGSRRLGYGLKHCYLRLHGSWNKWMTPNGEMSRRKVRLTTDELNKLTVGEIIERSLKGSTQFR